MIHISRAERALRRPLFVSFEYSRTRSGYRVIVLTVSVRPRAANMAVDGGRAFLFRRGVFRGSNGALVSETVRERRARFDSFGNARAHARVRSRAAVSVKERPRRV